MYAADCSNTVKFAPFFLSLFSSLHLSALLTFLPLGPFIASLPLWLIQHHPSTPLPPFIVVSLLFSPFLPICIEGYFVRTFFFPLYNSAGNYHLSVCRNIADSPQFHTSQIDFCVHRGNRSLILYKAAI